MINKQSSKILFIVITGWILFLIGLGVIDARVIIYSIIEKTRAASLIVLGDVMETNTNSISVKIEKTLKGISSGSQIKVMWKQQKSFELAPAKYQVGEKVIVFANAKDNLYESFGGSQGISKVDGELTDQYQSVIIKIIKFDTAQSPDEKTTNLIDMLMLEFKFARLTALEIIYLEYHPDTFKTAPLIQPVLNLSQDKNIDVAINSIQVLSRIGDKSVVPVLIQLLGSPDSNVAETAFRVLKGMTRAEIEFDSRQPAEIRAKAIQKWQEWWEQNKDKVILVK